MEGIITSTWSNLSCRIVAAKLFSSAGTGFMYTLRRPRTAPKFELRKYDPLGNI